MSVLTNAVLATLPYVPRPLMRRLASRYIAGERIEEALARLEALVKRGHPGVLDVLGEGITSEDEARSVCSTYESAASALGGRNWDVYVSVKPTHVGLSKNEELCFELYSRLARHCAKLGLFLRVEMEDAPTTDGTLRVFERLRKEHANVGIVLQARLFRTPDDIAKLAPGPLDVRMVKGIYLEPAAIAHTEPEPIRAAFVRCTDLLLARGARVRFATHDDGLADRCLALVERHRVPKERYEFQVLLGVREELWDRWKAAGHTVRVYVPYGPDWRAYSLRRMRKNPQIIGHVLRQTFGMR
ncbi:MAG: proline dehydrogenase family protein [Planctomycetes bacterium]|nr:proline dehydrogenase family protein [Planctomycetota bacterium]